MTQEHGCNVQLADEIMLISIISLIFIFAHAPVTKQLDIHKICAVTLTGKRPPNRDPELQRTELVQDTKALMVQDTKMVSASQLSAGQSGVYKCKHKISDLPSPSDETINRGYP